MLKQYSTERAAPFPNNGVCPVCSLCGSVALYTVTIIVPISDVVVMDENTLGVDPSSEYSV